MQEGMYLGHPPVNIGRSAANATLRNMMRGASFYGSAAGGPAPLATPQIQVALISPAGANRQTELAALYPLSPNAFKLRLRRQFGG